MTMIQLIYYTIKAIQPILVPICFVLAWTLVLMLILSVWSAIRNTVARAKQMHQIPCTNCQFFTNNYRMKCTVQPYIANTEKAIDCCDYRPGR